MNNTTTLDAETMKALEKLLNGEGLQALWIRIAEMVKTVTGDVEVSTKGTLQAQMNMHTGDSNVHVSAEDREKWNSASGGGAGNSYDVFELIYQLYKNGTIDISSFSGIYVTEITSETSVNIISGTYSDGKVYI